MAWRALACGSISLILTSLACADEPTAWWHAGATENSTAKLREAVLSEIDAKKLRVMHHMLATRPHMAGSLNDWKVIESIQRAFQLAGLDSAVHQISPYLAVPVSASLTIIDESEGTRTGYDSDLLRERRLQEDHYSRNPELPIGFNAYSASGVAEGEVVYANYGTREDFEALRLRDIDCTGKIVLTRYGRNFRGYKAYYAEQAGAAGVIIYTDPGDSGYARGAMYPEGGYANETSIQRGSILTLPYPGDPLTPFEEASQNADRLDPADIALPKIPVQPIGWNIASDIISRMKGELVPEDWRGGLDVPYRFTGGSALNVRVEVEQERKIMRTANVIGTLTGAIEPDKYIIVGCHHDAWGHGASDPLAGMIVVTECARIFGEAARKGFKPARTIIFAGWGAEEYGIIGSTEWCEANRDMLSSGAVAYINLDMASMGLNFGSSASPTMRSVVAYAAKFVSQPGETDQSVFDAWTARGDDAASSPRFGSLGGGSDHVGFYCHLGVPSASLGGGGSEGTAYHSNYDTIDWYQKVVGDDYASAEMVTGVCAALICELANAPLLPIDPRGYADDGLKQLETIETVASRLDVPVDFTPLRRAMLDFRVKAAGLVRVIQSTDFTTDEGQRDRQQINNKLRTIEQLWLSPQGLPERPWFANLYGASDPYSGYAAWVFPALRLAIEEKNAMNAAAAAAQILEIYQSMSERMDELLGLKALRDAQVHLDVEP